MNFFKKLFGGGSGSPGDANAMIVFVKPNGCDEVVRVRINLYNDPSLNDDSDGYFVQKMVMGTKCFQRAELTVTFDKNKRVTDKKVTGGTIVDEAAYSVWLASQQPD